jgi:hypothetical protein
MANTKDPSLFLHDKTITEDTKDQEDSKEGGGIDKYLGSNANKSFSREQNLNEGINFNQKIRLSFS